MKVYEYVTKLQVTNDTAERNINLLVTKMKKVRTHQRLQEAMVTTEDMRRLRKNYKRRSNNKSLIQTVVDKMVRNSEAGKKWLGEVEENESSYDEEPEGGEAEQEQSREDGEVTQSESDEDADESGGEAEQYLTSEVEISSSQQASPYKVYNVPEEGQKLESEYRGENFGLTEPVRSQ